MTIIADGGSTKTSWIAIKNGKTCKEWETAGINPVRDHEDAIRLIINEIELPDEQVNQVYFYSAGCIPPYSTTVRFLLNEHFPTARVQVESDMAGAAIALCGHSEGIACILGTGSNSCLFDGERIVCQTPSLGYILGDEGSGTALGKQLVSDVLKGQLPKHIQQAFLEETELTQPKIIERVYRTPQPNLFLSSLVPFLERHLDEPAINSLVVKEFRRFLQRNIVAYGRPELPVNFVGGITQSFRAQLQEAVEAEGMKMGKTLQRPIQKMAEYYSALHR